MLPQIVGILLCMCGGGVGGAALARLWRGPRMTPLRGAVLGAIIGAPAALLLQLLGGGAMGFLPKIGQIDWRPVVSTFMAGALCGFIAVGAVGVIRLGSRQPPSGRGGGEAPRRRSDLL